MEILKEWIKGLSGPAFIKRHKLPARRWRAFVKGTDFSEGMRQIVDMRRFHTSEVFGVLAPFLEDVLGPVSGEAWSRYVYQYALSYAFPEAVTQALNPEWNHLAEVCLEVLRLVSRYQMTVSDADSWQGRYPLELLTQAEIDALEDPAEYLRFQSVYEREYVYEMMKLNQEVMGYTTLDHICGVNHLAMNTARQLQSRGYKVDLGRVSGAAIGHDIGKYGCKPDEMHRVAYYHYFYTGEWFEKRDIVYIRNVAINHSTWDLELEALPIESLILIHSDFRVKSKKIGDAYQMAFYTLEEAFQVILDKLDNVDEAKENRYRRVYAKLLDFEHFLRDLGIDTEPGASVSPPELSNIVSKRKYFTLMQGQEITENVIYASIQHNIDLLYRLRDEASLNKFLEPVRSSRDMTNIRGYITLLEEYYTYLTQRQKRIMMDFLYEKLEIPAEDIRVQCAELIGAIIASYDEEIRKETPPSAVHAMGTDDSITMLALYLDRFLIPERTVIEIHKKYISYSTRDMLKGYFDYTCDVQKRLQGIDLVVSRFERYRSHEQIRFYLIKAARILPFSDFSESQKAVVLGFITEMLSDPDYKIRLRAYNLIYSILPHASKALIGHVGLKEIIRGIPQSTGDPAENYAKLKLAEQLGCASEVIERYKDICNEDVRQTGDIFLSNLKSATLDVAKRFQIELLLRNTLLFDYDNCFYMAMHLCNLLKVSALESVRNTAGRMLIQLTSHLTFEQKNDIAVELIRALEMESYEFTKYIPPYLGPILLQLQPKELDEILENFERKMEGNNSKLVTLIEKTVGFAIVNYSNYRYAFSESDACHRDRIMRFFGVLLKGFVHPSAHANQMAFSVIGKDIFSTSTLNLKKKEFLFKHTIKKIMSLMVNTDESENLIFYNNASSLKRIYAFISEFRHVYGEIGLVPNSRIAFFPGAFDPFTLGHKHIATDIRDMGFEVLLYVDEFSWSKRTQPNLIRRNIIKKSIAGDIDVHQCPRDVSVNIANEEDLKALIELFPHSELYLVVGSDVLLGASAYAHSEPRFIDTVPHIVYRRAELSRDAQMDLKASERLKRLSERSLVFDLPEDFGHISSSMIRRYIDEKKDIASLIDPMAQNYIYEKGLYQREPQYKSLMVTKSLQVEIFDAPYAPVLEDLSQLVPDGERLRRRLHVLSKEQSFKIYVLRDMANRGRIEAFSVSHWVRATEIHKAFADERIIHAVRADSVGRILMVDTVLKAPETYVRNVEQIMLTETLAHGLSRDYTYAIYKENVAAAPNGMVTQVLKSQGFLDISSEDTGEHVYLVDMSAPCTLNLDVYSKLKEPYRHLPEVVMAITEARIRLQSAIATLYPGKLVLSFERSMIHENLIKKVCLENGMPPIPLQPRQLGEAMCVPFGAVFNRWLIPNTVTKTVHSEKYFEPDLSVHYIKEFPLYLDLENQIKMLRSFNRPIILVDDLLNNGYRIQALKPYFDRYDLNIQKFIVGIMSGGGKEIVERMNIPVDAAYFIPKIKVWFYESKLYPFIDGDAIWRGAIPDDNFINSINFILPYAPANYIKDTDKAAIYALSEVALENAAQIMSALEAAYEARNNRMLTIRKLGEVLHAPRYPDKGRHIFYSDTVRPSAYILQDLGDLRKMEPYYIGRHA